MKKKHPWLIGIFGSAEDFGSQIRPSARALGRELGKRRITVINGACTGIPFEIAAEARKHGSKIWGFAPSKSYADFKKEYRNGPNTQRTFYNKLTFIPRDYAFADHRKVCLKYRNVTSTATCDAGIIVSGRIGTLNEFTNLVDFGKVIGVLTGTGGLADMARTIQRKLKKSTGARIIFNKNPEKLVQDILEELDSRKHALP